jgi:hypothetical protein
VGRRGGVLHHFSSSISYVISVWISETRGVRSYLSIVLDSSVDVLDVVLLVLLNMADIDVTCSDGEDRVPSPVHSPVESRDKPTVVDEDTSETVDVEKDKDVTERDVKSAAASDYLTMLEAHHEARMAAVDTATAAAAAAAAVLAWCPALMPPWCQLVPAWCRPTPIVHHNTPTRRNKTTSNTGLVIRIILHVSMVWQAKNMYI